jgi:hypothetical protein
MFDEATTYKLILKTLASDLESPKFTDGNRRVLTDMVRFYPLEVYKQTELIHGSSH